VFSGRGDGCRRRAGGGAPMHELSIAQSVASVALRHANGRRVSKVELKVGALRQVVPDALTFAWQMVTVETELEGSELAIVEVAAVGECRDCGARTQQAWFPFKCGACGALDVDVVAGEELSVESLELEEELSMSGGTR
jgi:hydrogenase nickel incorporation protein HypA/HybF